MEQLNTAVAVVKFSFDSFGSWGGASQFLAGTLSRRLPNLRYRRFPHRQAVADSTMLGNRELGGFGFPSSASRFAENTHALRAGSGNPRYRRLGSRRYLRKDRWQ
jgi:hypothetical protein